MPPATYSFRSSASSAALTMCPDRCPRRRTGRPGAGLAEVVDAERDDRGAEGATEEGERVRRAVEDVTIGARRSPGRDQRRRGGRRRRRWCRAGGDAAGPRAGRGRAGPGWSRRARSRRRPRVEQLRGRDRLRHHRPGRGDLDRVAVLQVGHRFAPIDQPVAAGQHLAPQLVLAERCSAGSWQRLVDRLGREAQVGREAVLAVAAAAQPLEQRPLDLAREARLVRDAGSAARCRATA